MKDQISNIISWVKSQDIDACITGSCLLDYFEGQDVDIFCYSESSFTKMLYSMYFNDMFILMEPLEEWKFKEWTEKDYKASVKKLGLVTIKFKYNTCIDVNIIYKTKCKNIFDVLSTFDMNIICKGYDLKSKQYLDLTGNPGKVASWNKWNTTLDDVGIWGIGRVLRQFERIIKYYRRGYNTDSVVETYKELIKKLIKTENIFNSTKVDDKLEILTINGKILLKIMDKWLETHEITEEEIELLKDKVKQL